jgi:hypothetical protein
MSTQPADAGGGGDTVVTDRQLFDHATEPAPSPEPSPAPSPAPTEGTQPSPAPSQAPAPDAGGMQRDPQGRFAPKPPPPKQGAQQPQQRQPEDHRVPLRELLDERERRQRIEAEHQQLMAHLQRQQQPQQPAGPETIFDGPDEYLQHRVMEPLRQEGWHMMMQMKDAMSRDRANEQFGEEAVGAALQELIKVRRTPEGDLAFRQIMAAGHPYGALMKWQQMQRAQAAIGNDPQAWLRQQQQQWFYDPKVREAMINDVRQKHAAQQGGQGRQPVSLPPSLSSVPASSGREAGLGDLSSESLFAYATKS